MTNTTPPHLRGLDLDSLLATGLDAAPPQPVTAWEPPSVEDLKGLLPGYEMVRLIGRGGMGAVYEARQLHLGRRVAVKILPAELSANEAFAERFRREARTLGSLVHGNILEVFEFGETAAGHLYYSMPYIEGGDLSARLKNGPLPQGDALRMVKEICAALEAAHAQGVIHRDIKPSNILLTAEGTVKVADFGIAVLDDHPRERMTFTGVAVGTLEYAAPEQAAGSTVDPRSDLYSVGVICYEVLTGRLPRGIFDPPSKVNAEVSPAVDAVVRTAMQSDPARRFQSATDFRAALSRTCTAARNSPRWIFAGAAAIAAAGATMMWWPRVESGARPASPSIVCWGSNEYGECQVPPDTGEVRMVSAGDGFTVAVRTDGTVIAWGRNEAGQTAGAAGQSSVRAVSAGDYHVVALHEDGSVAAWGLNNYGQCSVPAGLSGVCAVAAGSAFSLALKTDGTVVAWGADNIGQTSVPEGLRDVGTIGAGYFHSVAVKRDGTIVTWGNPTFPNAHPPENLSGVRAATGAGFQTLALKTDGTVVAWGTDFAGLTLVPEGLSGVQAIAAGNTHNLALKTDGTIVGWGDNTRGQAVVPAGLNGVIAIAAGKNHSVALRTVR